MHLHGGLYVLCDLGEVSLEPFPVLLGEASKECLGKSHLLAPTVFDERTGQVRALQVDNAAVLRVRAAADVSVGIQRAERGGDVGLCKTPEVGDVCSDIVARVVGQEEKNIQLRTGDSVLAADRLQAAAIEGPQRRLDIPEV